jgi:hypothetical protein
MPYRKMDSACYTRGREKLAGSVWENRFSDLYCRIYCLFSSRNREYSKDSIDWIDRVFRIEVLLNELSTKIINERE